MNSWASSANLTTQFVLHVLPQLEPTRFDPLHPMADFLCFGRGDHIIGINQTLGFRKQLFNSRHGQEQPFGCFGKFDEAALLTQRSQDSCGLGHHSGRGVRSQSPFSAISKAWRTKRPAAHRPVISLQVGNPRLEDVVSCELDS